mmetsp:Transcript_2995/g.11144  ORF Transcript_2995/g.11144 Transcript_2995/m.11144 type:complete len:235 (-) Transcript_2995:56-760(-)
MRRHREMLHGTPDVTAAPAEHVDDGVVGRELPLEEPSERQGHRRAEAHGPRGSPGGVHHGFHVSLEPTVQQPVRLVEDLRDDEIRLDDAPVDKLLDAPRGSDDAPRVRANRGELRLFVGAADDQSAAETRARDVPLRVLMHLRGELSGGQEHDRVWPPGVREVLRRQPRERVRDGKEVGEGLARSRRRPDQDVEAVDDDRAQGSLLHRGEVRDAYGLHAVLGVGGDGGVVHLHL